MRSLKQIRGINAYRQGTLFRAHCLTGNNREMEYPAAGRLAPYESFGLPLGAPRRTAARQRPGDDGTGAVVCTTMMRHKTLRGLLKRMK
jgi:hypothetical protein